MGRDKASSLAPGFRFHPTDEELVRYYLKRKILKKPSSDLISVIDIYRYEPWDLPDKSKLKSRDLEWYFFSALDKKHGNGSKTNRATERGYWKTTGKDRAIRFRERVVGMKKTHVYHNGRAPRGERTNWVMHEYRLTDEALAKDIQQDAFVLCRVFQKSGSGPKNGEQYGAPFIEEEWEDDEAVIVPGQHDAAVYEVAANDEAFVEVNDIDQESSNHMDHSREFSEDNQKPSDNMSENALLPSNFYYGESSNCAEHSIEFKEEPNATVTYVKPVEDEYVLEPIENILSTDYVIEDQYQDASDYLPTIDEHPLESNDLSNPIDPDSDLFDIGEYLSFDDADDQLLAFDYNQIMGSEIPVSGEEPLIETHTNEGTEHVLNSSKHVEEHRNSEASSKRQELETTQVELGTKYPFIKKASQMLGSFPAPPAFASEFPSKDAMHKLNAASQASSSVRVTAGMIRVTDMASSGNRLDWTYNKNGSVNVVLSFNLPQGDINSSSFLPLAGLLSGKTRGRVFLMLIWVLIISASLKMGSCIRSRYWL
ncbi:NAC domain-containing protein 17 [Hibiscus syriacus]|uniref:NAC domain-containing protein 17 n=1 Tax=Hibiscus syriacus TaxID=106335 RepID=A0A6A3BY07_HIBSY|nr:NAC domain-containing protein 17 [Hibiscus syriacus]